MKKTDISILGKKYEILVGEMEELSLPENLRGLCSLYLKQIKVEDSYRDLLPELPQFKNDRTRSTIVHEVFHAFVFESGLNIDEQLEETLATWLERMFYQILSVVREIEDSCLTVE